MNKNVKKGLFVLLWFFLGILIAAFGRYIAVINVGEYGWADSFPVWIGGAIIGSAAAVVLLIIDGFLLRKKIENKLVLNVVRLALLIGLIKLITVLHEATF